MNGKKGNWKKLFISQSLKTCTNFYQYPKLRNYSYNMKTIDVNKTEFSSFLRTHTKFNFKNNKKLLNSFHKTFLHKKLYSNPKFFDERNRVCLTERNEGKKIVIENYNSKSKSNLKNKKDKLFLTNNSQIKNKKMKTIEISLNNKNKKKNSLYSIFMNKINNDNLNSKNYNNFYTNKANFIRANMFIHFNEKKYQNDNYPQILLPKLSDFLEEIKTIRTAKFINNIKTEQQKQLNELDEQQDIETQLTVCSLTKSIKLLDSFRASYVSYNKFLSKEIKKEKNKLDNYIVSENKEKEEFILLEKKFDDLIVEFQSLTNFKKLFTAIKNRTKIVTKDSSLKAFSENIKEQLRKRILFSKKNITNPKIIKKLSSKRNMFQKLIGPKIFENDSQIKNYFPSNKNLNKFDITFRKNNKHSTVVSNNMNRNFESRKRLKRLNTVQPSKFIKKNNLEILSEKNKSNSQVPLDQFKNFDVQNEIKSIENNILDSIDKYNAIKSEKYFYNSIFSREKGAFNFLIMNRLVIVRTNKLEYLKKYNEILNSKYSIIKNKNKNYSFFFLIYKKINSIISQIIAFEVQNYQNIIDKIKNIYDNKRLFYLYKNEKNENRKIYFIRDIISYIFKTLTLIEKIEIELIQGKNNYLKSNYYFEQILRYENKMDIDKKLFNSRAKRNEEILRREKINENTINNLNKIIYKQKRKVPPNYKIYILPKKIIKDNNEEDENENLIFY